jgi:hypothetical protein
MNLIDDRWARRALKHARVLSKGIGARAATSPAEGHAAEYVRDEMRNLGLTNVQLEPFRGAVSAWLPWSVAFSIAAWAMLIGLLFGSVGGLVAALLYLAAAWAIYSELYPAPCTGRGRQAYGYPIRRWLWRGSSQNVVGTVRAAGEAKHQVVLMGYLDSARVSSFWRRKRWQRLSTYFTRLLFLSLLMSAVVLLLAGLTAGLLFYLIALVLILPQIAALLFGIRLGRSPTGPGANNNASGVASLLALAEHLKATPLANTEVLLLATGCRETGGDGLRAFCNGRRERLPDRTFIALEGVGTGDRVVYLTREGLLRRISYSPDSLAHADRAAERCRDKGIDVSAERHWGGPTEMAIISRTGFRGVSINVWPDDGDCVLGRRDAGDIIDTLQTAALARTHTFAWALLQEIDSQQ